LPGNEEPAGRVDPDSRESLWFAGLLVDPELSRPDGNDGVAALVNGELAGVLPLVFPRF